MKFPAELQAHDRFIHDGIRTWAEITPDVMGKLSPEEAAMMTEIVKRYNKYEELVSTLAWMVSTYSFDDSAALRRSRELLQEDIYEQGTH